MLKDKTKYIVMRCYNNVGVTFYNIPRKIA